MMDGSPPSAESPYRRSPSPAKTERQRIFVRNLRWAMVELGLTLRGLADRAGVSETWLRRAATRGVYWTKPSGREAVEKLEAFLGCPSEGLWEPAGRLFRMGVIEKHKPEEQAVESSRPSPVEGASGLYPAASDYCHDFDAPPPPPSALHDFDAPPPPPSALHDFDAPPPSPDLGDVRLPSTLDPAEPVYTWQPDLGSRFNPALVQHFQTWLDDYGRGQRRMGLPEADRIVVLRSEIEEHLSSLDLHGFAVWIWNQVYCREMEISSEELDRAIESLRGEVTGAGAGVQVVDPAPDEPVGADSEADGVPAPRSAEAAAEDEPNEGQPSNHVKSCGGLSGRIQALRESRNQAVQPRAEAEGLESADTCPSAEASNSPGRPERAD